MTNIRKPFVAIASVLVAITSLTATAEAAKPVAPFISVLDEQTDPTYDLIWQQPAHVTYSGSIYASFECDNQSGHAVWRSGPVDLTVVTDIPILTDAPLEGAYYYWCEASLLSGNKKRVIATDLFMVYSI